GLKTSSGHRRESHHQPGSDRCLLPLNSAPVGFQHSRRAQARRESGKDQTIPHVSEGPEGDPATHPETTKPRGTSSLPVCLEHPLLPVKKPHTNDYRPVQDLQEVNKRVTDIHPTVPNPYTLLSSLAPSKVWYTVLDLKDSFFSLAQSQPLFAFEWHDLEEGYSGQLTWTRLPQGFKNSPTIFDKALHKDLGEYRREHPGLTLLQYVDDILIAADMAKRL
uniref:Reverse transcriptase domain-containing protein n=1 Tax=Felis catus TaxID=9685 RepID=A0ABI7Z5M5_FELCA